MVVDGVKQLEYAWWVVGGAGVVAVDLEGWLAREGYLELLQVGVKAAGANQVLVFDFVVLREKGLFEQAQGILKGML